MHSFAQFFGASGTSTIYSIISARSLTTNLVLCIDAADGSSYDGTSQTWIDRTGTANFVRGTSTSSEGSDPTFSGVADAKSANEYFSFDGSDRMDSASGATWMNGIYKDNATFTIIAGVYIPSGTIGLPVLGQAQGFSGVEGANFNVGGSTSSYALEFKVYTSAGGSARSVTSTATATAGAWNFVAVDQNEASSTGLNFQCNSTQQSGQNGTYTSPSAADFGSISIGYASTLSPTQQAGSRVAFVAVWSTNIGLTSINNLYTDIKAARAYGF